LLQACINLTYKPPAALPGFPVIPDKFLLFGACWAYVALTALSLIFAVFLTNPSPICVLDEVDAPLDDSNVTRFCSLLNELTKITTTRFIIVTHHALTMSKMDRLYGITMPEKGISQLVAVDLQKAESMVA